MSMAQKIKDHRHELNFWITLLRGVFAILLGLALILQPEKVRPILVNFMGMFWMMSGIISLRWGAIGDKPRPLARLAGVIGILAGAVTLGRNIMGNIVSEVIVISLLGLVILLTGLLHAIGGFRTDEEERQWSWVSFILGVFEVILGILLLISPLDLETFVYWAASIWAFLGGFLIIGEALRVRRKLQKHIEGTLSPN